MSSMFSALVNRPHGPTPVREAAYSESGLDWDSTPALEPFRDFVKMQQCEGDVRANEIRDRLVTF